MSYPWPNLAVAFALGLLIGLERERTKGEGTTRRAAGIRTFVLATVLGAVALHVGGVVLLAVATAAIGVFAALSYRRSRSDDPGLTTEVALLVAPLAGALAMRDMALAAALCAVVAVVLAAKGPIHRFVKGVLTEAEVNNGLAFAIATLVIWPQLPDSYMGPFAAINPHRVWLIVILVLAIGACGHAASRALGPRAGLPLAGFAGGFVSSTAVIGAMGGLARRTPEAMRAAVAAAALSTVATFLQMALLLLAVSPPTLRLLAPGLVAGGVVAGLYGLAFTLHAIRATAATRLEAGAAFSLATAGVLAGSLLAVLVLAAALKALLGEAGIVVAAAVAGMVDTHAAAVSIASLVGSAQLDPADAVVPILAAMSCNAVSKTVMAVGAGSRGYALRIVPGLAVSLAATWLLALAVLPGGRP